MKNLSLTIVILTSTACFAQYDHNIQLNEGSTVTYSVTEIDSISFYTDDVPVMHLNLVNGDLNTYNLGLINQVTFAGEPIIYPSGSVHCIDGGAEVVEAINPTTGKTWMDRNLGASQVATALNDSAAYGDLYQWGRFSDGHQCRNSEITSINAITPAPNQGNPWDGKFIVEFTAPYDWLIPQNNNLWQGVNGTNNPCPAGYRLPTFNEWAQELLSWTNPNNSTGAFDSPLKLPAAGGRVSSSGSIGSVGSQGRYRSSTVSAISVINLYFSESMAFTHGENRTEGHSIRCIKD